MKPVSLIMACTADGGIGNDNKMPWYIPEELKKFKRITKQTHDINNINVVIMGRDTWESIGKTPLPGRINIILTRNKCYKVSHNTKEKVIVSHSINDALSYSNHDYIDKVFIIGGAMLYNTFLESPYYFRMINTIYLSVMFYDPYVITNKYIDMDSIFVNFKIYKDNDYIKECKDRLFASYICIPKNIFTLPESKHNI